MNIYIKKFVNKNNMKLFRCVAIMIFAFTNILAEEYVPPSGTIYVYPHMNVNYILEHSGNNSEIILKSGTYYNILVDLTQTNFSVRAEIPGEVYFTGESRITISGSNIVIRDIVFQNILWNYLDYSKASVIVFDSATNCDLTNCAFINCGPNNTNGRGTVFIYWRSSDITINSCHFEDIKSKGIEVFSFLTTNVNNLNKNIYIQDNYFKNFNEGFDQNDGWTGNKAIMLGYGHNNNNMNAVVEYNLFENCIGDGEIISNKANSNIIRYNTFTQTIITSYRTRIELRTGNNCIINNNVLLGISGGIVVHGSGHKIYNNYIERCKIGIQLRGGGTDYQNSTSCNIINNTIVNSLEHGIYFGSNDARIVNKPNVNYFYNNLIYVDSGRYISEESVGYASNIVWQNNYASGRSLYNSIPLKGYYPSVGVTLVYPYHLNLIQSGSDGLFRLAQNSIAIDRACSQTAILFTMDMDGQRRTSLYDIGADEYSSNPPNIVISGSNVGVSYNLNSLPKQNPDTVINNEIIKNFHLGQNYPNPFNPSTTISYSLPQSGFVRLKVYNMMGQEVANLVNKEQSVGNYKVEFNASNLTSGVYFYRLQSGSFTETKKLILLR